MKRPSQLDLVDLMPKIDRQLIKLLKSLSDEDWQKPTIAPKWKVKDIAAHLLDGNLRAISMLRDDFFGEIPEEINSYQNLLTYLNRLNADWVTATKRLSPKVIIDLLSSSGKQYCDFLKTLDPAEKATFSVAWAGENESKNWFHIAREYTEKWHHQQQIRLAVGKEKKLLKGKWYLPYLDTSVRGLPHHYRNTKGTDGDLIKIVFRGKNDKCWFLGFHSNEWILLTESGVQPNCEVIVKDNFAWRIFTKGMDKITAIKESEIIGDQKLGKRFFDMIAVMA